MKKLEKYIPNIKFNKYVYIGIAALFVVLLGGLRWQHDGGIKIGSTMLIMSNYDKTVELSGDLKAKFEAEVQKYDDLINKFIADNGGKEGNWTNKEQEWFLNKAENLYNLGENNKAIRTLYKALGYFPDSSWLLDMLGNIYAQVEAYNYALNNYNKLIELDSAQKMTYAKKIIRMYVGLKDADKAGKLYIEFVKNGGEKDLQLINQIRALRGMDPMKK